MALAILELVGLDDAAACFRVDTGTNQWFSIRFGRRSSTREGFSQLADVVAETPLRRNEKSGLLDSSLSVRTPLPRMDGERSYAQLSSFRTQDRRGPALSRVVQVAGPPEASAVPDYEFALPRSAAMPEVAHTGRFQRPRAVVCRSHAEQLTAPSLGDLLAEVIRVAGPIVAGLLQQPGAAAPPAGSQPVSDASAAGAPAPPQLLGLLGALLRQIPGLGSLASGQSLLVQPPGSRFGEGRELSRPFVFGIDDALIGAAIGQLVQILPQLANAAGQKRVQMQANQNKLVSDIVSDVNRRLMLEQLLDAQRAMAGAGGSAPDLSALAALLEQAGVQQSAAGTAAAPVMSPLAAASSAPASGQSLSLSPGSAAPSARAVAAFVTAPALPWNGRDYVLLARSRQVSLDVKLVVGEPVPTTPLPKAIIRVIVKQARDQRVVAEKVVKRRNLAAGVTVKVVFAPEDLQSVPSGERLSLLAEIRWRTASGRELQAHGASEAVLVDRFFVKERGSAAGPERELTDMERYRAFWNKLWESPTLDAPAGEDRKLLWALDATLKYSLLVVGDEPSNGVMETRVLAGEEDASGVTARTQGRMKGGMELSVDELNKLASLWDGEQPLDEARLAALRRPEVCTAGGGEIVQRIRLQGKAAERGLVWLVPVLSPVEFTLGAVQTVDEAGQVIAVSEEKVRLPLPVAVRVLGVKSGETDELDEPADESAAPAYRFAGFRVDLNERIALTPAAPGGRRRAAEPGPAAGENSVAESVHG
jgi:hypothetical protein